MFVSMHSSPIARPGSGDAGGMNVVEEAVAGALADLGHDVQLVTRRADAEAPDAVQTRPGVTLRVLPAGPARALAKSEIDQYIDEFASGLRELAVPDVVHSHHWMSGVAALGWAREHGVPHVQSFHSVAAPPHRPLSEGEPPESPHRVPGERLAATQSDLVVAISVAEARTVVERCGAEPERVSVLAPGVDTELFRPLGSGEPRWQPRRFGRSEARWDNGYVVFAARLQPLKGPDLALRALAHVEQWMRPHLLIAGDTSEDFAGYADQLHTLVGRLGLERDVTFIGPVPRDELAVLLRGARLLLVPSHSETFGLIALEAAASGVPVLASAAGGLREAVAHQETGQLIDSREPEDWGRAMTYVLGTPGVQRSMGTAARIHARRFEWSWTARRLVDLYRELLVGGGAS